MNNKDRICKINIENLRVTFSYGGVKSAAVNPWITKPHFHSSFELQYVLSGNAQITAPNENKILNSNTFCIIPPKTEHFISGIDGMYAEKFAIRISLAKTDKPRCFDFYGYVTEILGKLTSPFVFPCNDAQMYIERLISLSGGNSEISELQISALLELLLISVCRYLENSILSDEKKGSDPFNNKNDLYSAQIESYIVRNYDKKVSLKMLSDELHLSERQCERIIKQHFDMDFRALLLKQRMVIAKQLVGERVFSLEEISEKCGYSSYAGFYKAFKQYYKVSPGKFHFSSLHLPR